MSRMSGWINRSSRPMRSSRGVLPPKKDFETKSVELIKHSMTRTNNNNNNESEKTTIEVPKLCMEATCSPMLFPSIKVVLSYQARCSPCPQRWAWSSREGRRYCNIRECIGNGFHTLDHMYTMFTYPSYDRLLSTIGLSLETGAREARMNESGQLVIQTLVPSGPCKLVVRNSWLQQTPNYNMRIVLRDLRTRKILYSRWISVLEKNRGNT